MHPIYLAIATSALVVYSFAGPIIPIIRSVSETTTSQPVEAISLTPQGLQDRSNGFDNDISSVSSLLPSIVFPEGTTGTSFLVVNPVPTDHSSNAGQQSTSVPVTSASSTAAASRPVGIIRPLSAHTSRTSSSAQNTQTHTDADTQAHSSTSRAVGTIVSLTQPEPDQTTDAAGSSSMPDIVMVTTGASSSTETASITASATAASEKTTTIHTTSTTTLTVTMTITLPATVTATKTKTDSETVVRTTPQTSSHYSPTGVDVIPVHPTWLTTSPTSTTANRATTTSSYSPTGVDVIPVHPTWLSSSSTTANYHTTSSSYSPTGVDVIPVHPTWL